MFLSFQFRSSICKYSFSFIELRYLDLATREIQMNGILIFAIGLQIPISGSMILGLGSHMEKESRIFSRNFNCRFWSQLSGITKSRSHVKEIDENNTNLISLKCFRIKSYEKISSTSNIDLPCEQKQYVRKLLVK